MPQVLTLICLDQTSSGRDLNNFGRDLTYSPRDQSKFGRDRNYSGRDLTR